MGAERYSEVEGDAENVVLDALAGGMPYAFVVATSLDPLDLRAATNHGTEIVRALLNQTLRALTAALCKALYGLSWRSREHHPDDGPMFEGGYFVVGINLPTGPITYHYKLKHWDDFSGVPELPHAPKWDGATPNDTVTRLLELQPGTW